MLSERLRVFGGGEVLYFLWEMFHSCTLGAHGRGTVDLIISFECIEVSVEEFGELCFRWVLQFEVQGCDKARKTMVWDNNQISGRCERHFFAHNEESISTNSADSQIALNIPYLVILVIWSCALGEV